MKPMHPHDTFPRLWNVVILLFILYNALVIPFQLGFNYHLGPFVITFDYIADAFFLSDILVHFYKSYYHEGILITDTKKIRWHYLKTWFPIDAAASLPLDLIALVIGIDHFGGLAVLPLLRLPRLLRITRIFRYFAGWEKDIQINPSIIRIIKLALSVALVSHLMACAWFNLGVSEAQVGESWIISQGILNATIGEQYIRSLYWALVTMTTVGYGDITPNTPVETLFTMVAMCIGVSVYAYIIGNMASLIANIDFTATVFRQKMDSINEYMRFREIPEELQDRVRSYYDYVWARNKGLKEESIISELPTALRVQMALFLHREVLRKVPLFQGAEQSFLNSLVMMLKPMICSPDDYVIYEGDIGREMFFISRGEVEVLSGDGKTIYATLDDGSFFGEIALLFSERRTASIRATSYCDLFRLSKKDFDIVLKDYPEFANQMMVIAKERYKKH